MRKTYIMGDLHFSSDRPWDLESFSNFIRWFEQWDIQNKKEESELLLEGDLTEKSVNAGIAISLLTKFIAIALQKFNNIIIIGGNHDLKIKIDGKPQYSSQYLQELGNVKLVYDEEIFDSEQGLHIIALPYKSTACPIESYYNDKLEDKFYKEQCDLITGHVSLFDSNFPYIAGIDLSKFHFKHAAFGHIHQRYGKMKQYYTGSIMPFRISEQASELSRCIKVIDENSDETEVTLPAFRVYHTISYSTQKDLLQHKKHSDKVVHVYKVDDCDSKDSLMSLMQDYYVIEGKLAISSFGESVDKVSDSAMNALFKSKKEAFESMLKEKDLHLKRGTLKVMNSLFQED